MDRWLKSGSLRKQSDSPSPAQQISIENVTEDKQNESSVDALQVPASSEQVPAFTDSTSLQIAAVQTASGSGVIKKPERQVGEADVGGTPLRTATSTLDRSGQAGSYFAAEHQVHAPDISNTHLRARNIPVGRSRQLAMEIRHADRIFLAVIVVVCVTFVAVLLYQHSLKLSSLSASNRALTKQYLALRRDMRALQSNYNVRALSSVQDYNVRKVVEQQLAVYDADKIGLADYALESQGGAVLATPDTVTYYPDSWFQLLGFPLFRYGPCSGPSCILQPSMQPGNCWAFRGTRGSVKIRLARRIHIITVTMEHISSSIAISGDVSSAPKKFLIAALVPGPRKSFSSHTLGMYEYDISGPPLQSFSIQNAEFSETTSLLQLSVLENHGNPTYTCIYRFRVHGHEALMSPSGGGLT